jgi:hypothetical protein
MRIAALIAALVAAHACAALAAPPGGDETAWRAACHHYENRARFLPRAGEVEPIAVIAEACPAAIRSLDGAGPEAEAARAFLGRLGAAHAAMAAINRDRFAAAMAARAPRGAREFGLVTTAGEFLILRAEGVFDGLARWADRQAGFPLISALP